MSDSEPKIHIDADWKAQAQADKERLAKEVEEKQAAEQERRAAELPPASFRALVGMFAEQAIMGLGAMQDPKTGGVVIDLEGARFTIDLLGVIEEKTKGNLSEEEAEELGQVLGALRTRFVQIAKMVAEQMAKKGGVAVAGSGAPGVVGERTTPGGLHIPGA
jgi:molybdopterin converting factor small subunit